MKLSGLKPSLGTIIGLSFSNVIFEWHDSLVGLKDLTKSSGINIGSLVSSM
jgi:hypothetical protein